jgi:hypothetical protein
LKESLRDIVATFPSVATADRRSFENSHVVRPEPPLPRERKPRPRLSRRGRIRSASIR